MFTIYCDGFKITSNPVSYHHIITVLFHNSTIDWQKLNVLEYDTHYQYKNYIFVREV